MVTLEMAKNLAAATLHLEVSLISSTHAFSARRYAPHTLSPGILSSSGRKQRRKHASIKVPNRVAHVFDTIPPPPVHNVFFDYRVTLIRHN